MAVQVSTVAITCIDFAPMMDKQWQNSELALASNNTALAKRFRQLVQLKVFGIAIML
jgi:hypothetical protein